MEYTTNDSRLMVLGEHPDFDPEPVHNSNGLSIESRWIRRRFLVFRRNDGVHWGLEWTEDRWGPPSNGCTYSAPFRVQPREVVTIEWKRV